MKKKINKIIKWIKLICINLLSFAVLMFLTVFILNRVNRFLEALAACLAFMSIIQYMILGATYEKIFHKTM